MGDAERPPGDPTMAIRPPGLPRHGESPDPRAGAGAATGLGDAELLDRFNRAGGAGVGDAHPAEDAFQATFLVLMRRAASLRAGGSLGPWLHEVAYRVSASQRTAAARRVRHERRAAEMVGSRRRADEPVRARDEDG